MAGLRLSSGFFFLILLPFYLAFKHPDLSRDESVLFSIFVAIALYPLLLWYIDRLVQNITLSLFISSGLLYVVAFVVHRKKILSITKQKISYRK